MSRFVTAAVLGFSTLLLVGIGCQRTLDQPTCEAVSDTAELESGIPSGDEVSYLVVRLGRTGPRAGSNATCPNPPCYGTDEGSGSMVACPNPPCLDTEGPGAANPNATCPNPPCYGTDEGSGAMVSCPNPPCLDTDGGDGPATCPNPPCLGSAAAPDGAARYFEIAAARAALSAIRAAGGDGVVLRCD
jgi:hypothetical protein